MRVDVEGEADVRVSQKLLDVFGVYALPQEERSARVAEVVKASAFREPRTLERGLERAVEVAAGVGRSDGRGKDEPVIGPEPAFCILSSSWRLRCSLRADTALRVSRMLRPLPDFGASKIQPPFGSESVRRTRSVPASRSRSYHLSPCNSPRLMPVVTATT